MPLRLSLLCVLLFGLASAARADATITFEHGGHKRVAVLHLPARAGGALPLVILLHGAGGSGEQALSHYGWPALADAEGFAVLAPDAMPARPDREANLRNNPRFWDDGSGRGLRKVDDTGFILAAVEQAARRFDLDRRRLYAAGHSSGSGMAQRLGLDHADRIAAIGVVAGQRPPGGPPKRPLPVVYINGAEDTANPVAGGVRELPWGRPTTLPPLSESLDGWARFNGCAAPTQSAPVAKVSLTRWGSCRDGAEVLFYLLADQGHQWPGGKARRFGPGLGPQSNALDATRTIWDFFHRHPLPPG
ncbi:alpha/beta hydrolase family esterase [Desertibaculum subflavum]|uniref:alpha/beta hydrolase family esterase n=1 Tax=Desertibaculum subflavum TaxID=2268458 RepID=UPI0013C46DAE